jgi:hypothetical protein
MGVPVIHIVLHFAVQLERACHEDGHAAAEAGGAPT